MKKLIGLLIGLILSGIALNVYALPTSVSFQNILPFVDNTYSLGTSTKVWANGFFNSLTLPSLLNAACLGVDAGGAIYDNSGGCGGGGGGGGDTYWVKSGSNLYTTSTIAKVGVLTTSPSTTLHVIGTFRTSGVNTFDGVINASSTITGSGAAIFGSTLHAGGATDIASTLGVTGLTSLTTLNASGAVNASSTFVASGAAQLQSSLYVIGAFRASSTLQVTGSSTIDSLLGSQVVITDGAKSLGSSVTTATELGYLSGVTSAVQTQINAKQASDATLTALAAYNTNGLLTQTAADTFAGRTLTSSGSIEIINGNGVSGNPTVGLWLNSGLPQTCSGTDKVSAISNLGIITCSADQNSGSGGGSSTDWIGSGTTLNSSTTYNLINMYATASSTQFRSPSSTIGTLKVSGTLDASSTLTASGVVTFGSTFQVGGVSTFSGTANFIGLVNVSSTLTNSAATVLGSTLHAGGAVDFSSTLEVTGLSTLAGVNASGVVNASSSLNVSGATMLQSTTFAIGAVRASSTLEVTGHAQFGNVSSTNEYVNGTLLIPTTGTLFSGMIKNNTASGTLAFHDGTAQRSLTDGDCTLSYSFGTNGIQSGVVLVSPHATFATSTAVNVYAVNGGNPSNSDTMSFNIFLTNNRATATSSLRSLFTNYQTVTATTTANSLSVNGSTTIRSSDMMLIDFQPASTTDASIVVCKRVD